jgi:coenzyme PQQ precursor peptide PqqA
MSSFMPRHGSFPRRSNSSRKNRQQTNFLLRCGIQKDTQLPQDITKNRRIQLQRPMRQPIPNSGGRAQANVLPSRRKLPMKTWNKPQVREQEVGLEVTSYMPAEIDII